MIYGKEKVRQMARSILPSRRGRTAKENLRAIEQRHRAMVKRELRLIDEVGEPRDCFDPHCDPQYEVAFEVRERRDADKLSHFEKWAVHTTKDIPDPRERVVKMRAMLPKGLIGDHAMTHLENYDEFRTNPYAYGRTPDTDTVALTEAERVAAEKVRQDLKHAWRVRVLREVVASGWGHRLLNRSISHETTHWPVFTRHVPTTQRNGDGKWVTTYEDKVVSTPLGPTVPRKLGGLGDVESFLADLRKAQYSYLPIKVEPYVVREVRSCKYWYRPVQTGATTYVYESPRDTRPNPEHHPEWIKSVDQFIEWWEDAKGDKKLLLAAHPVLRMRVG